MNTLNVADISSETENYRRDSEFNAVQNEAKYNKSDNNMLTPKAKNHGRKKKTLSHVTILFWT